MKITLRKANALQTVIQEFIRGIEIKPTVHLNEFEDAEVTLFALNTQLVAKDDLRDRLTRIVYRIRGSVGVANAASGVSDRLAESAYIDRRIAHMTELAKSTAQESVGIVQSKLEKLRNTETKSRMYGYGDTVEVGVLRQDQIDAYKGIVLHLKKQKQKLNDEVLELNVRTEIELSDETVAELQQVGLL
jgi:hypothetical protein